MMDTGGNAFARSALASPERQMWIIQEAVSNSFGWRTDHRLQLESSAARARSYRDARLLNALDALAELAVSEAATILSKRHDLSTARRLIEELADAARPEGRGQTRAALFERLADHRQPAKTFRWTVRRWLLECWSAADRVAHDPRLDDWLPATWLEAVDLLQSPVRRDWSVRALAQLIHERPKAPDLVQIRLFVESDPLILAEALHILATMRKEGNIPDFLSTLVPPDSGDAAALLAALFLSGVQRQDVYQQALRAIPDTQSLVAVVACWLELGQRFNEQSAVAVGLLADALLSALSPALCRHPTVHQVFQGLRRVELPERQHRVLAAWNWAADFLTHPDLGAANLEQGGAVLPAVPGLGEQVLREAMPAILSELDSEQTMAGVLRAFGLSMSGDEVTAFFRLFEALAGMPSRHTPRRLAWLLARGLRGSQPEVIEAVRQIAATAPRELLVRLDEWTLEWQHADARTRWLQLAGTRLAEGR